MATTRKPANCPVPGMGEVKSENVGKMVWGLISLLVIVTALWSTGFGGGWLSTASLFGGGEDQDEDGTTITLEYTQINWSIAPNFTVYNASTDEVIPLPDGSLQAFSIWGFPYRADYLEMMRADYEAGEFFTGDELREYYNTTEYPGIFDIAMADDAGLYGMNITRWNSTMHDLNSSQPLWIMEFGENTAFIELAYSFRLQGPTGDAAEEMVTRLPNFEEWVGDDSILPALSAPIWSNANSSGTVEFTSVSVNVTGTPAYESAFATYNGDLLEFEKFST